MFDVAEAVKSKDLGRNFIEKEPIVTNRNDRSFVSFQRCFQCLARRDIQMVGRLVEHQHIDTRVNQFRQRQPSLLSA